MEVHERDLFKHNGVVDRLVRVLAPGERAVVVDEHGGNLCRVDAAALEFLDDDKAGVLFIRVLDLLRRHAAGAGDLAVEIVALRGAHGVDAGAGLRKAGRPAAVRVDNAADGREGPVQFYVRRRVGRGLETALDALARFKTHEHDIVGGHFVIFHARRLDGDQAAFAVDGGDVAPCKGDEIVFWQGQIGFQYLLFQCFQHSVFPSFQHSVFPSFQYYRLISERLIMWF